MKIQVTKAQLALLRAMAAVTYTNMDVDNGEQYRQYYKPHENSCWFALTEKGTVLESMEEPPLSNLPGPGGWYKVSRYLPSMGDVPESCIKRTDYGYMIQVIVANEDMTASCYYGFNTSNDNRSGFCTEEGVAINDVYYWQYMPQPPKHESHTSSDNAESHKD